MSIMESDNIKFLKDALDNAVIKKTIKVYKLVKFDDHFNKNGNFYKDQEYFSKEEAFQVQKALIDQWHIYCNSSEENKKRANEHGPMTIKVFSFDLTEEE